MALEPVEVPPDQVTEPQPQQAVEPQSQAQEPAQTQEDFLRFKVRGLQREIPTQEAERFAGYLGWKPDALVNRLQMATDAERIYGQLKRERDEFEAERQSWVEAQQKQEQDRAARLQGRAPAAGEDGDDPIAYLRTIPTLHEEIRTIRQQMTEERQAFAQELRREREQQTMNEITGAYESFIESKKSRNPKAPVYDLDSLVETAEFLGIDTVRNPVNRILEAAYRYLAADELPAQAQEETLRKLRDPRAQVIVPGSSSTAAQPTQPQDARERMLAQVEGMKYGEIVPFIPERR